MSSKVKQPTPMPDVPFRWTLRKAAAEHGVHPQTIQQGLKKHGISPGADQKYSTQEIDKAIFDSERYDAQTKQMKLQKAQAEAEKAQMEVLELRQSLVEPSVLEEFLVELFNQLAQAIRHMPHLDVEQREQLLRVLHEHKYPEARQDAAA